MKCWHCGTELIWGGDHDMEDDYDYDMVTNLSCPKCHTHVDVYYPSERLIKEYKDYSIVTNLSCPKCHTHVDVYYPSERLIKEYKDYDKKRKRKKTRRNIKTV